MRTGARQEAAEMLISIVEGGRVYEKDWLHVFGVRIAAEAVLAEVGDRAELLPCPAEPVTVQLDLGIDDERLGYLMVTGGGRLEVRPGWSDDAPVTIRQELAELVHAVFGPPGRYEATREVRTQEPTSTSSFETDDPAHVRHASAVTAAHQVLTALSQRHWELTDLAVRFGSDKWGSHWYTPLYDRYFHALRDDRVRVLEIGIGGYHLPDQGGASLRMWKRYFRRGVVHGLDVYDKQGIDETRLRTHRGDQGDPGYLDQFAAEIGPLDIVIDDGSHLNQHVITSFHALFPHVRPGGLYVIEDVQTAYWPGWGGREGAAAPAESTTTSIDMVKALIDGLHHQERTAHSPTATDLTVTGVHLHHNLVVIEKGRNTEQGAPDWVSRDEDPRNWLLTD